MASNYSKAMCKCRRRSVFLVGAMAPAPLGELAAVWGRHTAPSPMYGRYGIFCRYIVDIPMHRARSKCRSRVRVLAPTTEQVPVFFRDSVYRPYDAVIGLYRLALPVMVNNGPIMSKNGYSPATQWPRSYGSCICVYCTTVVNNERH